MTTLQTAVYEAFRPIGIPEEMAAKVAVALIMAFVKASPEQDAKIATPMTNLGAIKTDVLAIKLNYALIKGDWRPYAG